MNDDASGTPTSEESEPVRRYKDLVVPMVWVGLGLAIAGVVVGLVMAFKRTEAPCEDGTYFPEGTTDFRCFDHPQALEGTAVAVLSLLFAVVIVLIAVVAKAVLTGTSSIRR